MAAKKTALIVGVGGQDGAYLADFLLSRDYIVVGTSRDAGSNSFQRLHNLGIHDRIHLASMSPKDFRSVIQIITKYQPDEIYNLSGQSSVALSFDQPVETLESITVATINLLEALRILNCRSKFYNSGSSECFGDTGAYPADESTPFRPRSPYAVAKTAAIGVVAQYREAYGLHACSGILFNHESLLRPERFVSQKIALAAVRISKAKQERLTLGNLDIHRDWGWAPEYVEAMWAMLQLESPEDLVIATGESFSLKHFVDEAFRHVGLEWERYVDFDPRFMRPTDIQMSKANPSRAAKILNWRARTRMPDIIRLMVNNYTLSSTLNKM
jgi:GDPmannose 4,6-dehydratase